MRFFLKMAFGGFASPETERELDDVDSVASDMTVASP